MSLREIFDNRVLPFVSLSQFDEAWCRTLNESSLFGIWLKLKSFSQKILAPMASLGAVCEFASFILVVLLFFILAAPQFADDKYWLALLLMSAFSLRLLATLLTNKVRFKPSAIDLIVLAFLAMNVISTAASHYLLPSIKGLSKMAVYFCSYFLFVGVLQKSTRNRSLVILAALLGAGFLVSLKGIEQYIHHVAPLATWEDPNVEDKTTRVYSTLKNPNLLAGYLIALIPFSLGLTIMSFSQRGWQRLIALPTLAVAAVISLCAFFTGSRGGWMAIAAALATLGLMWMGSIWSSKPKLRPLLVLIAIAIPVALVSVLFVHWDSLGLHKVQLYVDRLRSIGSSEHSSNAYRMNVYRSSIKMFRDSWWLGVGPGNTTFKLAYGLYMKSGFDALGAYCVPLEVAVETGVIGLACFAWLVFAALARAHQNFWSNAASTDRWIAGAAAAGLVGMMVQGMVDTVFYRPQVQFIFWLLLALCICNSKLRKQESLSEPAVLEAAPQDQQNAA